MTSLPAVQTPGLQEQPWGDGGRGGEGPPGSPVSPGGCLLLTDISFLFLGCDVVTCASSLYLRTLYKEEGAPGGHELPVGETLGRGGGCG